jgi:hypothetical protein
MDLLGMVDPGVVAGDALTGLAFGIIRVLALFSMGIVLAGVVMTCLCDIFECRKLRPGHGRTENWQPMP